MSDITMNYEKIDELLKRLKKVYEQFSENEVEYRKSECATKNEVKEL